MKMFLEQGQYELNCISPVHIGSGIQLQPFEYLYDRKQNCVYIMDKEGWIELLSKYSLMDEYRDFMALKLSRINKQSDAERINVLEWLRRNRITDEDIRTTAQRRIKTAAEKDKFTLNTISLAICEADGSLYIPGSSIKGALRTGILYVLLRRNPKMAERFMQSAQQAVSEYNKGERNKKLKWTADSLEQELLRKLSYEKEKGTRSVINDVMRGLKVSDANADKAESIIVQKLDASTYIKKGNDMEKPLPLYRECAASGSKFKFTISMDREMMGLIGFKKIDDIIKAAKDYKQQGLEMQKKVFGREYAAEIEEAMKGDIFIGGGTGFLQKTLWFSLFPDERQGIEALKKYLDGSFRKHRHPELDKRISPRTLKLANVDGNRQMMGLCQILKTM